MAGVTSATSKNNTLNLHSSGLAVEIVQYFQQLNFYLPSTLAMGGTMLTTDQVIHTREQPLATPPVCAKIGVFLDDGPDLADPTKNSIPATLHEGDITLMKINAMGNGGCFDLTVPAAPNNTVGGRPYTLSLVPPAPAVGTPADLVLHIGKNAEAGLVSDPTPGGWQVTPIGGGSGLTKNPADLIKISTTVPYSTTVATLADIMKIVSTDSVVTIYSDAGFTTNANATGVALSVGSGNHVYMAVTSEDGATTLYYDLTVTRSLALSTSAAAAVPTLGEWALMLLALAMLGMAGAGFKRRG